MYAFYNAVTNQGRQFQFPALQKNLQVRKKEVGNKEGKKEKKNCPHNAKTTLQKTNIVIKQRFISQIL